MDLIDFILNLVGTLIWLNWRSLQIEMAPRSKPATLAGTLKRPQPNPWRFWLLLATLPLLLFFRALLYWHIGTPAGWTPKLDLSFVVLSFRADQFYPVFLYSVLSFARLWLVCCFWMLTLAALNRHTIDPDAVLKFIRTHLGVVARWHWSLQWLFLPVFLVTGLWLAVHPALVYVGTLLPSPAFSTRLEQGLLVASSLYLTLKLVLPVFLLIHLIVSYVYVGQSPLWDFINHTSINLLKPLKRLRFLKIDFAPVFGVILLCLLLHWLPRRICAELAGRHMPIWPQ